MLAQVLRCVSRATTRKPPFNPYKQQKAVKSTPEQRSPSSPFNIILQCYRPNIQTEYKIHKLSFGTRSNTLSCEPYPSEAIRRRIYCITLETLYLLTLQQTLVFDLRRFNLILASDLDYHYYTHSWSSNCRAPTPMNPLFHIHLTFPHIFKKTFVGRPFHSDVTTPVVLHTTLSNNCVTNTILIGLCIHSERALNRDAK